MNPWVLLLRGVNVGGRNILPMASLRAILKNLNVGQVRTILQSGNAVFVGVIDARAFGEVVEEQIEVHHGFRPRAMVLSGESFAQVAESYPWPEAKSDPKTGHIWFLDRATQASLEPLQKLAASSERLALGDTALYLHAPDGIGRSKLAQQAETLLGVPATARNLATVQKITALLAGLHED